MSRAEMELAEEHWDSYGSDDTLRALADMLQVDNIDDAPQVVLVQLAHDGVHGQTKFPL